MERTGTTGRGPCPSMLDCPPLDLTAPDSWPDLDITAGPLLDISTFPPLDLSAPESWPDLDITAQPPLDLYAGFAQLDLNAEKGAGRPETARPGKPSTRSRKARKTAGKRL